MAHICSIGELRRAMVGLADDRMLISQVVAADGSAWACYLSFAASVPNSDTGMSVLALSHPDLLHLAAATDKPAAVPAGEYAPLVAELNALSHLEGAWYADVGRKTAERCCAAMRGAAEGLSKLAEFKKHFEEAAVARDTAGFLGSPAECIKYQDDAISHYREVIRQMLDATEKEMKDRLGERDLRGWAQWYLALPASEQTPYCTAKALSALAAYQALGE